MYPLIMDKLSYSLLFLCSNVQNLLRLSYPFVPFLLINITSLEYAEKPSFDIPK